MSKQAYAVTIKATVEKVIYVYADSEEEATEAAEQEFSLEPDPQGNERYHQETEDVEAVDEVPPFAVAIVA